VPVSDQGECSSGWAFSACEAISACTAISQGKLVEYSTQQLIDCDTAKGQDGCSGGDPVRAFEYLLGTTQGDLELASDYPYKGKDGPCEYDPSAAHNTFVTEWTYITTTKDETEMEERFQIGPMSVCIDARIWQFYESGVIDNTNNCGSSLNHCAFLVGLLDYDNMPIWVVQNSWGSDWGMNGYIYLERGNNVCGIANHVSRPC